MLALSFRSGDVAFVFHNGNPIGAILVGDVRPNVQNQRVSLVFCGTRLDFEIMRSDVVKKRFGSEVLERLIKLFLS